jgi:hypothetical protein
VPVSHFPLPTSHAFEDSAIHHFHFPQGLPFDKRPPPSNPETPNFQLDAHDDDHGMITIEPTK